MKPCKVIFIPADVGKPIVMQDIDGSLQSMQALVGGMIERVQDGHGHDFWCNENGLAENLPVNWRAGAMLAHRIDGVVGDVFITGRKLDELYAKIKHVVADASKGTMPLSTLRDLHEAALYPKAKKTKGPKGLDDLLP